MLRIYFVAKIWRLRRLVWYLGICSDAHSGSDVAMQDATAAAA